MASPASTDKPAAAAPQHQQEALRQEREEIREPAAESVGAEQRPREEEDEEPAGAAEELRKRETIRSLGESAAGSGTFSTFPTSEFRRQRTSLMYGLPSQLFLSRASIRTWGAENIADPMVQPYDPKDPNLPKPFHVSLPGYAPHLCEYVITKGTKPPRDPMLGPDISIFPPVWIPSWRPDPAFVPQPYNYNWEENGSFHMDRLPYHHAQFEPHNPAAHNMYMQGYPFTAYPYGVPAV